ncbi:MAG TPA: DUF2007 domain-containing protein [Gemmataceae bacterium]|nr:DUF2007 domain-containing protein [Gemmataceae bacterium]
MSDDKMVLLAIYGNLVEAELARAELQAEGIRACVLGATSGDVFAGMGVGISNVQLLVLEGDYERATVLLANESDMAQEARENREWEEEEETESSPAIKDAMPPGDDSTDIRPAVESSVQAAPPPAAGAAPDVSEEMRGDLADQLPDDEEREERSLTWTPDDMAVRAFRAALFGYLTCGVLHLYALWLLSYIPFTEGELSPGGARKAWTALALASWPFLLLIILLWRAIT